MHDSDHRYLPLMYGQLFSSSYRPNLCETRRVYETQTYSSTYQRQCRRYFFFGTQCSLRCRRTENCDGGMVNVTKTELDCCDGFGEDPSLSSSGGYFGGRSRRSGYSHGSKSLRRNGCPVSKFNKSAKKMLYSLV
jgi:hypothetical protein